MKHLIDKLEQYRNLKNDLAIIKAEELALRKEICHELLKGKGVGVHKFEIDGTACKVTSKVTYKVDPEIDLSTLSPEELDCVKTSYSLILKNYKVTDTLFLDEYVTTTPALPTLEVL